MIERVDERLVIQIIPLAMKEWIDQCQNMLKT